MIRSYQKPSQSYKQELHKQFASKYNPIVFYGSGPQDAIDSNVNEDNTVSPIIKVKSVSFHVEKDGLAHNTHQYDLMRHNRPVPVYRRGQCFSITLRFDQPFNLKESVLHLQAEYGPKPSLTNGTKYKIQLSQKKPDNDVHWEMWSTEIIESEIMIQVQTPANCQVGMWKFSLFTYKVNTPGFLRFDCPEEVYILFNPWNKNDSVFLEVEKEREEYVLNDHGKLYMGTHRAPEGLVWVFGQFSALILPALTLLMEEADLPHSLRGSPVLMSRAISAVVNSSDNDGLIKGKWKGGFDDGTNPMSWTGSLAFFERYLQTGRTVKYAQCWVFSGAVTTACRALGIPCRPITCYVCAHDTNQSLTVDKFFNKDGKLIEGGADGECWDSIWNFHCWNDVWMQRPDLPPGYDGWQALDGTPQELSKGKYRTGPSSLKAIKLGNIGLQYDTGFVFSEVNSDVCHFQEDSSSPWGFYRIKLDSQHVGRRIVTQSLFNNAYGHRDMEEITHLYKQVEGTEAERLSVFNAVRGHLKAQKYYKAVNDPVTKDVFFKLIEIDNVIIGDAFSIALSVENHSSEKRTINANLSAISVLYTGKILGIVKQISVEVSINPKEEVNSIFTTRPILKSNKHYFLARTVRASVLPEEYKIKVGNNCHMKLTAVASVSETKQTFSGEDDFEIIKNRLKIKVPESMKIGNVSEVYFYFINPFTEPLTNCELTLEGPGLQHPRSVKLSNVVPNGQMKHSESLVPKKQGSSVLVATFNSDQLTGIKGSQTVWVHQ